MFSRNLLQKETQEHRYDQERLNLEFEILTKFYLSSLSPDLGFIIYLRNIGCGRDHEYPITETQ